jgi:plastocyanin
MYPIRLCTGLLIAMVFFASGRAESQYSSGYQGSQARFVGRAIYVYVQDHSFFPSTITVAPGTVIHWVNMGKHVHTVTSDAAFFHSGDMAPGSIYSVLFTELGTHEYHCRHHEAHQMRGTINVRIEPFAPPAY